MKRISLLMFVAALTAIGACGGYEDPFEYHETNAPTTPSSLVAAPESASSISLTWLASWDDTAVKGYKIYRGGVYITFSSSTSATDTGLSAAATYCYTVSAIDYDANESAQSDQACATTTAGN